MKIRIIGRRPLILPQAAQVLGQHTVVRLYHKGLLASAMQEWLDAAAMGADEEALNALLTKVKAARALQSKAKIAAVATLTRGQDCIRTWPGEFDTDPELLNCGIGVVNLRTGVLEPHDPDLLMRKFTPVNYVPGAVHPDWVTAPSAVADDQTRAWLQVLFGASATGYLFDEDIVPFQLRRGSKRQEHGAGWRAVRAGFVRGVGDAQDDRRPGV